MTIKNEIREIIEALQLYAEGVALTKAAQKKEDPLLGEKLKELFETHLEERESREE